MIQQQSTYWLRDYALRYRWLLHYAQSMDSPDSCQIVVEQLKHYEHTIRHSTAPASSWGTPYKVVWSKQSVTLRAYTPQGIPVFIIPSLINQSSIFDLTPQESFIGYLIAHGLCPYLLDWGRAEEDQEPYDLKQATHEYVGEALAYIQKTTDSSPFMVGYCLGGTVAIACASYAKDLAGLVLMAVPWDFSHLQFHTLARWAVEGLQAIAPTKMPIFPGSWVYQFLNTPYWEQIAQKYQKPLALTPVHQALDQWMHHPRDLSYKMTKDLLHLLLGDQTPDRLLKSSLEDMCVPTYIISALKDHLVPLLATQPLVKAWPHALMGEVETGHLGLMASKKAQAHVWNPLVKWMKSAQKG